MSTSTKVEEIFLPIPEFKGFYEVSDLGNVRSLYTGRNMKPWNNNKGYACVRLTMLGKQYNRLIHRLVLLAHAGDPGPNMEGNHKDGDKQNNHLFNLEWATSSENKQHAQRIGLNDNKFENNPGSVLNLQLVNEIKLVAMRIRIPVKEMAEIMMVHPRTIRDILNGKSWKNSLDFRKSSDDDDIEEWGKNGERPLEQMIRDVVQPGRIHAWGPYDQIPYKFLQRPLKHYNIKGNQKLNLHTIFP